MRGKNKKFTVLLALVCFITNLSQLPVLVANDLTRYLSFPGWIIVTAFLLFAGVIIIYKMEMKILGIGILFFMGVGIAEVITSHNHLLSNMISPFYLSIFILLIGLFSSHLLDKESIYYIAKAYIISVLIVSFSIYLEVFSTGINWNEISYAYPSKNSISQMILTAIIFLYLLYNPSNVIKKIFKWLALLFWLVLLAALKSRATIIGIFIMIGVLLLSKLDKKKKLFTIGIIMLGVSIIIVNQEIREVIIDNVLLGSRETSSLDDISSGRITHITVLFPLLIEGNELLGTGTLYVENFILNSILKHGLLFGWILILVAIWPLWWGVKYLNKSDPINVTFIIIAIVYFINGLFEAQAPFGPGTKNYILWLMFGILYGLNRIKVSKKILLNNRL